MTKHLVYLFILLFCGSCRTQPVIEKYQGNWEGKLPDAKSLNFEIAVEVLESERALLSISNRYAEVRREMSFDKKDIDISLDDNTQLKLQPSIDKQELKGFMKSGSLMYHINLKKNGEGNFFGSWNPFMVDHLQSQAVYLSVEVNEDGTFATYPFFGDERFTGTWASDFNLKDDLVFFRDFKTGLSFQARLFEKRIHLEVLFAGVPFASSELRRSETEWKFGSDQLNENPNSEAPLSSGDGWRTAHLTDFGIDKDRLNSMIIAVLNDQLENTNSVLIAKSNTLIFEAYFDGFNANIPHDQRSGSKSISSAMIGIAIDDEILEGKDQRITDCLPEEYRLAAESSHIDISIHDLLTMSSGLDVSGRASEGTYQDSDNWLKTVMEAPMVNEPGTYADYGSANPFLLGVCLNEKLDIPIEAYMDQQLLRPLGISNYIIQTDDTKTTPYFGGGMYLTPRDMLKFGQLYLNMGEWEGKQIISESWVQASFEKHTRLQDVRDKNEYGYQWWHNTYAVGNKEIESIEARGAGGQYIFVMPSLESVVVITSGNFRNGRLLQQPEKILEEYILPAMVE